MRFRENSVRLRVNRHEVQALAAGRVLREKVVFPNLAQLQYQLEPAKGTGADASFADGVIRISAPLKELQSWADGDSIGLYFEFQDHAAALKVAIEKDLECVDGPPEERDPDAFPRSPGKNC